MPKEGKRETEQPIKHEFTPQEVKVIQGLINGLNEHSIGETLGPKYGQLSVRRIKGAVIDRYGGQAHAICRAIVELGRQDKLDFSGLPERMDNPPNTIEIEVMGLTIRGISKNEIALRFNMSPDDIRIAQHSFQGKLKVKNLYQATGWMVREALRVGLL